MHSDAYEPRRSGGPRGFEQREQSLAYADFADDRLEEVGCYA